MPWATAQSAGAQSPSLHWPRPWEVRREPIDFPVLSYELSISHCVFTVYTYFSNLIKLVLDIYDAFSICGAHAKFSAATGGRMPVLPPPARRRMLFASALLVNRDNGCHAGVPVNFHDPSPPFPRRTTAMSFDSKTKEEY